MMSCAIILLVAFNIHDWIVAVTSGEGILFWKWPAQVSDAPVIKEGSSPVSGTRARDNIVAAPRAAE